MKLPKHFGEISYTYRKTKPYNKFHVSPKSERTLDGIVFASKAEMRRYSELKILEKTREIFDLKLQPKYLLVPKTRWGRALYYIADFEYTEKWKSDITIGIVEDVKGVETDLFRLKFRLAKEKYPEYDFRIVK